MRNHPFIAAASALVVVLTSGARNSAEAAPPGVTTRPIDLDLSGATVTNVFNLLAEVTERTIVLDPCVRGSVDLRLKNTPTPLVFDALAMKLSLVYVDEGDRILVRCAGSATGAEEAEARVRVSLNERGTALRDVVSKLAASAGLEGGDYRATRVPAVSVALEGVRLSTALAALGDESGLKVVVVGRRVVVGD
jgi:hypothetical protein